MTLEADELLRRFLPHVLPAQFRAHSLLRLLANRQRAQLLNLCRSHLLCTATPQAAVGVGHLCQHCHRGTMRVVEILSPIQLSCLAPDPPVENPFMIPTFLATTSPLLFNHLWL